MKEIVMCSGIFEFLPPEEQEALMKGAERLAEFPWDPAVIERKRREAAQRETEGDQVEGAGQLKAG